MCARALLTGTAGLNTGASELSIGSYRLFLSSSTCYAVNMPKVGCSQVPGKGLSGIRNSSPNFAAKRRCKPACFSIIPVLIEMQLGLAVSVVAQNVSLVPRRAGWDRRHLAGFIGSALVFLRISRPGSQ
jgi:hypothetical protein